MKPSMDEEFFLGLDIGSTTVKIVAVDRSGSIVFSRYARHFSEVREKAAKLLEEAALELGKDVVSLGMTGSGALALAEEVNVPFIQEVAASGVAIRRRVPDADVIIELGGEDAKLTYLTGGVDQRMNETCAGGTGAFIDQMAAFIRTDAEGLDRLAARHKFIYPIASRCGVFAKTDILPLLNEGASREDIAASVMQAVVNQTISGLARGRAIRGKVVLLGGPLAFLPSLRERFAASLGGATSTELPEHAQYFVAYGAALYAGMGEGPHVSLAKIISELEKKAGATLTRTLPPLFGSAASRKAFFARHSKACAPQRPLESASGEAWLGFDSGSTTIKAVLLDREGNILFSSYGPNLGDPLAAARAILGEIYACKPKELAISASAATGYGSALLASALGVDFDEVETVAHFKAARHFEPRVTFVLDIGGQDIKCMRIRNGAIIRIQLNEACSSGCGSFIENFSESLNMPLADFVRAALDAKNPADLGTRCTVFMNSKVKQVQKEDAEVSDIAAGLCYSVIRNACFKVMKLAGVEELGEFVVAQGGAFANDALLRALELILGRNVTRPAFPGLMGAYGAALIAMERGPLHGKSTLISPAGLAAFSVKTNTARCKGCSNRCLLTVSFFGNHRRFVSGNRCERGAAGGKPHGLPNLFAYKYARLFGHYEPLSPEKALRGSIGIPRALNMYENYPLWFTLFTNLGFRVELSAPSSKELFHRGHETIPSQTVCYPAKLAHGHLFNLVDRGVKNIFFPCIPHEQKNFDTQDGTFNCPVVIGYPELLANNVSALKENGINFIHEFLPLDEAVLPKRLRAIPLFADIPAARLEQAVHAAFAEMEAFHADMRNAGEKLLAELAATGRPGLVLAGHPYHIDPEVHHGVAELVNECGMAVLTEDSVAHLAPNPGPLRVVDQWTYHSRLYRAGAFVAGKRNIAILQLISFGCGLDAITAEQLEEIVSRKGRLYAQIKIDEGANLGPARIRIRSVLAALRERMADTPPGAGSEPCSPKFTEQMRATHTILIPQMAPLHFRFLETVFKAEGLKAALLPSVDREAIDLGLRYVNNDACFPAIVVIGQLLQAIRNGSFDPHAVALAVTQTGGGCRATNYVAFLRKALYDCGLGYVPIVAISTNLSQDAPGLHMSGRMLRRMIMTVHYGDALMRMLHRTRPYEAEPGSAEALVERWVEKAKVNIADGSVLRFELNMFSMIREFDRLPLKNGARRPRVGLVGEILLTYHPDANNHVVRTVEKEGGEVVSTDIADFLLYLLYDHVFSYRQLTGSKRDYRSALASIAMMELTRLGMHVSFGLSRRFTAPAFFRELRKKVRSLISLGHQTGEGWLLTAEMVRMLESGTNNILCMQPFGCLPNHITGKGLIRELKRRYAEANIIALDYDAGASEVNQINRIKLMMSVAKQAPHGQK